MKLKRGLCRPALILYANIDLWIIYFNWLKKTFQALSGKGVLITVLISCRNKRVFEEQHPSPSPSRIADFSPSLPRPIQHLTISFFWHTWVKLLRQLTEIRQIDFESWRHFRHLKISWKKQQIRSKSIQYDLFGCWFWSSPNLLLLWQNTSHDWYS